MSGGYGTRLWPLSSKKSPKQFNQDVSNPSLFTKTLDLAKHEIFAKPIIVGNVNHRFLIENEANNELDTLILEPESRNTMPAILAATLFAIKKYGEGVTILVLSSDHLIANKEDFIQSIQNGIKVAEKDIVIFGIKPTKPETGYGYIEIPKESIGADVAKVICFKEKPTKEKAEDFLNQGNFYWNAGIFLFNTSVFMKIAHNIIPQMLQTLTVALHNSKLEKNVITLSNDFLDVANISIDYAILEKTSRVVMSKMLCNWNDLGSFASLYEVNKKDEMGNVVLGNVLAKNTNNCFIQNTTATPLAVQDINNINIVVSHDGVLVLPISSAQEVKHIAEKLTPETARVTYRPWGRYEILEWGQRHKVKRIIVLPKKSLSLQSHEHRSEHWVVIKGVATVINGEKKFDLHEDESTFVPKQTKHRLMNNTNEPVEIIEVQSGNYLEEDDITRYEDC